MWGLVFGITCLAVSSSNASGQGTCPAIAPDSGETCGACSEISKEDRINKMVLIKGGSFKMGTNEEGYEEGEYPERLVYLQDFYLDETPVTNEDYNFFVENTEELEFDAAKLPETGGSVIFAPQLDESPCRKMRPGHVSPVKSTPWMTEVKGLSWEHPYGSKSCWKHLRTHPVVHVTWKDAKRYCEWVDKRLPTEAEWEYACRAGREGKNFPWGNKLSSWREGVSKPEEMNNFAIHRMNTWQGQFPNNNTAEDGFNWTSPVKNFPPSDFEVYDMTGNVWEWVSDYWHIKHPTGPLYNPRPPNLGLGEFTMKGGSFLCPDVDCCRCASRRGAPSYYSSSEVGFRCAKSVYELEGPEDDTDNEEEEDEDDTDNEEEEEQKDDDDIDKEEEEEEEENKEGEYDDTYNEEEEYYDDDDDDDEEEEDYYDDDEERGKYYDDDEEEEE